MLKKVILITGANGEIGQYLIKELNRKNIENILAIDLHPLSIQCRIEQYLQGSILDIKLLKAIQEKYIVSEIYHLAAILSTKAEKNIQLANDVNIKGTKNILDLAKKLGKKYMIKIPFFFPSSIAVYNTISNNSFTINEEMTEEKPITIYGQAKLKCEKMGFDYMKNCNSKEIDFRCIRFPGIISASTMPSGGTSDYVPEMIHHAAKNLKYECFIKKDSQLPFIVMPDAIQAIFNLMNADINQLTTYIYNITSFNQPTHNFYLKIKNYYPQFEMIYDIDLKRQKIVDSWPNNINDKKAKEDWGWEPQYNFDNAFNKYIFPEIKNIIQETM